MPDNSSPIIREIRASDNENMAGLIRSVLEELNVPKVGTAYEDSALDDLTAEYRQEKAGYFVLQADGQLMGGSGHRATTESRYHRLRTAENVLFTRRSRKRMGRLDDEKMPASRSGLGL